MKETRKSRVEYHLVFHEMARRLMLKQEPEEISQAMGIRLSTVKNTLRKPEFKRVVKELQEKVYRQTDRELMDEARDIRAELQGLAGESLDRLTALLRSAASEAIQKDVAQDLLDRAGYGKHVPEDAKVNIVINPIDADVIATALRKEREGQQKLRGEDLAKPPSDLEHPLLKKK